MKQLNWYQIFGKSNIPDGATVLPTDDIQILLNCADIWDKSYTALNELLADADTLLAVINSENAVNYLVRSTTWAAPKMLVPEMTSNNTPSGICLCDSNVSGEEAYKAFDRNNSTYWESNVANTTGGQWVGYKFTTPQIIDYLINRSSAGATNNVKVQYSDDDVNWVDTGDTYNIKNSDGDKKVSVTVDSAHYSYRIYCTSASSTTRLATTELNFYSPSISESADAMAYIGQNNYCANTLLADATWCEAICRSEYFESVLNVKVPTMTSNTTPSGECFGSAVHPDHRYYYAFDGNTSTHWYSPWNQNPTNGYIGYKFVSASMCKVMAYNCQSIASNHKPLGIKVQGSNDGVTYIDLASASWEKNNNPETVFFASNTTKYLYYRMFISGGTTTNQQAGATELQFYGREDV